MEIPKQKRKYTKKKGIVVDTSTNLKTPKHSSPIPTKPSISSPISSSSVPRKNESYSNLMGELVTIMAKRGDFIRNRVYRRAQETILSIKEDIHSPKDLNGKPGIGPIIIEKLHEYEKTGTLSIIEKEKENPENILSDIYGVGPKKAKELVAKGITSISQLREKQNEVLNDIQKVGLKYYEDIQEKIPRKEIDEYAKVFQSAYEKITKTTDMKYEIVGSYRRGAVSSGDIDVIITSDSQNAFDEWINELLSRNIIIEILSRGKSKCLVITRLTQKDRARRVDFLYTTPAEYAFAVLYFTGSKGFNATMRGYALKKGVSLNEHGLSKMVDKKKEEKLSLNILEERGIFDYLDLVYKTPEERIDGRAVVAKDDTPVETIHDITEKATKESPKVSEEPIEKQEQKVEGSPKSKKTSTKSPKKIKNKTQKVPKGLSKDPKEIESFCMDFLNKKSIENREKSPKVLQESPKISENESVENLEKPSIKLPVDTNLLEELPKGPTIKKIRKNKTVKIFGEPKKLQKESPKDIQQPNIDIPESPIVKINYEMDKNNQKSSPKLLPPPKNTSQKNAKGEPKVKIPKKTAKNISKSISNLTTTTKSISKSKIDINPSLQEPIGNSSNMIPKYSENVAIESIKRFKQNGIGELDLLSQSDLVAMIFAANANYYNDKGGLMTDNEYDIVKEYLEKKYPTSEALEQIGAPIEDRVRNKVTLPYEMWSMDKIKPDTNALVTWMKTYKGSYVVSCKLDGVSGLYTTEGDIPKLYTRGDGKIGQDISFLLPSLKLPKSKGLVVRGEFIIPKKVFEEKYAQTFANPRNLVSGIVNAKKADEKANDLHFVAYEVIQPSLKPSDQLKKLKSSGLEVVQYETRDTLSNDSLSETLVDWRTNHLYEIDGIIVTDDAIHPRISGNPDHAFAFKMILSDQKAEAKVVDVLWSPSKDGYLKPRVRIEPIRLGGVTIEYATGYNAKFIEDNKIGIGAAVEIIRSGDVIPKILAVTVPAETPKMPIESYTWNDTHVDILLANASENAIVQEKNITTFFSTLEIDGLKAGNVKKLMTAGYDTIPKILKMTKEDFTKVGYKTLADKYVENIHQKVKEATIIQLMVASGVMGRGLGEKKLSPILEKYPDILVSTDSIESKIAKVKSVKGIESKSASLFVENIPRFIAFLDSIGQSTKLHATTSHTEKHELETPKSSIDVTHPLYGKKIVMTKVRDVEIINALKTKGATLEDTINSKTFVLIVKSMDDVSSKTKYAVEHKIPIMMPAEFKTKYLE